MALHYVFNRNHVNQTPKPHAYVAGCAIWISSQSIERHPMNNRARRYKIFNCERLTDTNKDGCKMTTRSSKARKRKYKNKIK